MSEHIRNVLLTLLAVIMLAGFALAIPSAAIREEAEEAYMNQVDEDDEYAFLFE